MSLSMKIANLLSGINDPTARIDIASTINYLFSVYSSGNANENEIRDALYEILIDVLRASHPELVEEEIKKKARTIMEDLMQSFRMESAVKRTISKFGGRFRI